MSEPDSPRGNITLHFPKKSKNAQTPGPPTKFEIDLTHARAEQLMDQVNHTIVKLLCVLLTIVDSEEWKTLMNTLNPHYCLTPSPQFVKKHIPREAAHVCQLTMDVLQKQDNLTLTFDGNSTHSADSVYLVHYTTLNDHRSYLVNGYKGSDEWHDWEWVKGVIIKVCLL